MGRSGPLGWLVVPGEQVCVVVERPDTVRTEPVAGTCHDEVRLRHNGVAYRDGWRPLLT
jgi:hypothetical protein